jgi:hypothetical protein
MAAEGSCALGPAQIVVSWRMLDTLHHVLLRVGLGAPAAAATVDDIAKFASLGPMAWSPYLVLGGTGIAPLRDTEDAAVLEVAIAAGADLLVIADMADFAPGPRSRLPARIVARHGARPAALSIPLPDRPDFIIATPQRAAEWLSGGPRPRGVLPRFPSGATARLRPRTRLD